MGRSHRAEPRDAGVEVTLERLYRRVRHGIRPGLDVERRLLEKGGNPHLAYGVLHVAGTNGKGSVCAMADAVLRKAGWSVGLYTSPHLVRFHERIRFNGRPIGNGDLRVVIGRVESWIQDEVEEFGRPVTFFEYGTAMAFEFFRQKKAQFAVVETGMGGRLDATNVVMPLVSVITTVSREHVEYLGRTVEEIALEKAGIIKEGRPVVCGRMDGRALEVVRRVAQERGAPFLRADEQVSVQVKSADLFGQRVRLDTGNASYGMVNLPLAGPHQLENLAAAVTALETVSRIAGLSLTEGQMKQGLSEVRWPGRLQVLETEPLVVMDGAHNPGAGEALAIALRKHLQGKPLGLVVGMCADKDMEGFLKQFAGLVRRLWAVPIKTERSYEPRAVAAAARALGWEAVESTVQEALGEAAAWARAHGGAVCVTGSLFLVGEVLETRGDEAD